MARKPFSNSTRKSFGKLSKTNKPSPSKVTEIGQAGRKSLRIIAGGWRGRKIPFATVAGLRPTQDRVRETLYNWVADRVLGANCLDLYAGTGALGLEALSRGASNVDFVELSGIAASTLKENLKALPLEGTQSVNVAQMSSFDWIRSQTSRSHQAGIKTYDLVLLDPPFALALMQDTLDALFESKCLAANAAVYLEQAQPLTQLVLPEGWALHRSKKAGQVFYGLITKKP
jgi:16S rRNA (guanine966-N2)-methyltransferase